MDSRKKLEILRSLDKIATSLESLGMIKHADVIDRVMTKLSQEKDTWFPKDRPNPGDPRYLNPNKSIPRIIEMDQWHAQEIIRPIKRGESIPFEVIWDDNEALSNITGGDTEAIKAIFGGNLNRLTDVPADKGPRIGSVWFKESDNGDIELYKSNYDSSD